MMMNMKWGSTQKLSKYLPVCIGIALLMFSAAIAKAQGPPKPPPPPPANQTLQFNFANPVVTASTEFPGAWYLDRYPPCEFMSPETAPDGTKDTLEENICATDSQANRPSAYSSSVYNTQGRKYDLLANTYSTTISLYVPSTWATTNAPMAGFWATAFDSTGTNNGNGDFPIIEFQGDITSGDYPNAGVPGFYGWNNVTGAWDFIGLPPGFKYNAWFQLTITLIPGTGFHYTVSQGPRGVSIQSPLGDSTDASLGNVILEGYNYASNYSIFWNNLNFSFTSLACGVTPPPPPPPPVHP